MRAMGYREAKKASSSPESSFAKYSKVNAVATAAAGTFVSDTISRMYFVYYNKQYEQAPVHYGTRYGSMLRGTPLWNENGYAFSVRL